MNSFDLGKDAKTMVASPRAASVVFDIASGTNVRPRGLFYIRFRRPILSGGASWRQGIGFVAKSVDAPQIQPQAEELNQYGRKRVIYTGVKYNPITLTFFDTVDNKAGHLWQEYAQYYFGDFNHANAGAWRDDITSPSMENSGGMGYGFKARTTTSLPDSVNSQFFFECLEIFQLYGNRFIQTDLINPKITSYEPDGDDYEDMSPVMIRMQLSYEGIVYRNGGQAQEIETDEGLFNAFKEDFSGGVWNPEYGVAPETRSTTPSNPIPKTFSQLFDENVQVVSTSRSVNTIRQRSLVDTGISSTLSRFGNFEFGEGVSSPFGHGAVSASGDRLINTVSRESFKGESLFDTDRVISTIANAISSDRSLDLSDAAMTVANMLSDGTVQIGRRKPT